LAGMLFALLANMNNMVPPISMPLQEEQKSIATVYKNEGPLQLERLRGKRGGL